jgi:hypothetical protein
MESPPHEGDRAESARILEYHVSSAKEPLNPRALFVRRLVLAMACSWPLVGMLAGISSDRVRIPTPKKLALSASAAIIAVLLLTTSGRNRSGCAVGFILVAMGMVAVMWFWN